MTHLTKAEKAARGLVEELYKRLVNPGGQAGPSFDAVTFDPESLIQATVWTSYSSTKVPAHSLAKAISLGRSRWRQLCGFTTELTAAAVSELNRLQVSQNSGCGISCVRAILFYLRRGDVHSALVIRQQDGDKTASYPEVEDQLLKMFGCRLHGKHDCPAEWCIPPHRKRSV